MKYNYLFVVSFVLIIIRVLLIIPNIILVIINKIKIIAAVLVIKMVINHTHTHTHERACVRVYEHIVHFPASIFQYF